MVFIYSVVRFLEYGVLRSLDHSPKHERIKAIDWEKEGSTVGLTGAANLKIIRFNALKQIAAQACPKETIKTSSG